MHATHFLHPAQRAQASCQACVQALIMSLVFSLAVFYGVHFMGQWIFFWLIYLTTQCIGISALPLDACCQHQCTVNSSLAFLGQLSQSMHHDLSVSPA